ncbi:MAG TPA: ABC transporter permease [Planctomycetaceae bacterium]
MILRFAFRSLARRSVTAVLLVICLGVAFGLPGAVRSVVAAFEQELTTRAEAVPLVLGAKGSRADLVLHALYFRTAPPGEITVADWQAFGRDAPAEIAPLCVRATARGVPVVGTDGTYFRLRGLALASGDPLTRLGDCVLGAEAADRLGLGPGDRLATDIESLFSLSGGVPVRLRVVGVMAPTGSADDAAAFVSLETAWLVAGLGHTHANPREEHDEPPTSDAAEGYIEVTDENVGRFHFHGNRNRFPLTAVIAEPRDAKARLLLVGRYLDGRGDVQLAEADRVLREILGMALRLRRLFDVNAAVTVAATLLLCGAVVALTVRLRWSEVRTMDRLGLSRGRIVVLFAVEFGVVALAAAVLAGGITAGAGAAAPALFRWLVL